VKPRNKVIIRADASTQIGSGHVMRCLTLAEELRDAGSMVSFVSRAHPGNLNELIREKGFQCLELPEAAAIETTEQRVQDSRFEYGSWLGVSQQQDAKETIEALRGVRPDWLIVDHYGLDEEWETLLRPHAAKTMVIDDLADRRHNCDLLLDQTFGRGPLDYEGLTPSYATILCGSRYALLRPDFAKFRNSSWQVRNKRSLERVFVNLGGVDKDNITCAVLRSLEGSSLSRSSKITVVLGKNAPWREDVQRVAREIKFETKVLVGVSDMARLMSDADFAIGASGSSAWERCCIGLPTAMIITADNQKYAAIKLHEAGAAWLLDKSKNLTKQVRNLLKKVICNPLLLKEVSDRAAKVTDGRGCSLVTKAIIVTCQ
jgi:UDP-2,4-diacetamido-2,4,6-trideoxy-beta-L-altropyranose hydrolase